MNRIALLIFSSVVVMLAGCQSNGGAQIDQDTYMMGKLPNSSAIRSLKSTDAEYAVIIIKKIKANINYKADVGVMGNPKASFRVRLFPNGEILSVEKIEGSGIAGYDTALVDAIKKSSPLPKKSDGTVERILVVDFSLKDSLDFLRPRQNNLSASMAELNELNQNNSFRPKKTYITSSTREVGYAMYYKMVQKKIEKIGTLNFPTIDGKRLYGNLIVMIPIFQDGSIFEKEGGPRVEKSSGNELLDKFALNIVRQSAPFEELPNNLRSKDRDDLLVIITRFNFAREEIPVGTENADLSEH